MDINNIRNNIRSRLKANKATLRKEHQQKTNIHSNKYYGSKSWTLLRNYYYTNHPLCECCLKLGIVKTASEVHHLRTFMSGVDELEKWELFLDEDNLASLCSKHHKKAHEIMRAQNRNKLSLDELVQYEQILNDNF